MKMTKTEALELITRYRIPITADFHTLKGDEKDRIQEAADFVRYRARKNANGSRQRMFFEFLVRKTAKVKPRPEAKMRLQWFHANSAFAFTFGDQLCRFHDSPGLFFQNRLDAIACAQRLGLDVTNSDNVVLAPPKTEIK